ncbi:hypothetical protein [Microbacterium sediminis]|uniref:Uncharacterized protein n=1 Tax=Microbacterium sediminis TaxID=904291 RepID=A0A1B9NH22_9MICO|nr:hypothetical protein [Microbacterium sediminis]OCG75898.1 hypothetical protein A7J15_13110 [Microbacterium sediminis]QBR73335.1 hypothetical protein E3O41_02060 [Microbacterium sediminis]
MEPRSAWRANDLAAYDAACEAANGAIAALLGLADDGAMLHEHALAEASAIRRELVEVDAFNRSALETLLARMTSRIAELSGPLP